MCGIFGWSGEIPDLKKQTLLDRAGDRGRNGLGLWCDAKTHRILPGSSQEIPRDLTRSRTVLGQYRATPTTEAETKKSYLPPYGTFVFNGVIANDQEWGDVPVDSMIIPTLMEGVRTLDDFAQRLQRIQGSFALVGYVRGKLFLGCNFKPIHLSHSPGEFLMFGSMDYMIPGDTSQLKPYTVREYDLTTLQMTQEISLLDPPNRKVLLSFSGGLDSTTVAYYLKYHGYDVTLVNFQYGANAETQELTVLDRIAEHGEFKVMTIPLPHMSGTLVEGQWTRDKKTGAELAPDWISARNLMMMSTLAAIADQTDHSFLSFGGNLEESGSHPDNEQMFSHLFNKILPYAVRPGKFLEVLHPLTTMMKSEIVELGLRVGVPYELTWSCYGPGPLHCGECGPCFMRAKAFERNGLVDPVEFQTNPLS